VSDASPSGGGDDWAQLSVVACPAGDASRSRRIEANAPYLAGALKPARPTLGVSVIAGGGGDAPPASWSHGESALDV